MIKKLIYITLCDVNIINDYFEGTASQITAQQIINIVYWCLGDNPR